MKRFIDIVGSSILLLASLPVLLLVSVLVLLFIGRPVLFTQSRPGLHHRSFKIYKFRSMLDEKDKQGNTRSEKERITPFCKLLRSSSLDELPGLWNVLKGDMSLVGPRPLLDQYVPLYNDHQRRRSEVRPGITGWAQVNGRNSISWDDKFNLDVWYVDNQTFALDVKILLMTIVKVVKREDISKSEELTMEPFSGNSVSESNTRVDESATG